MSWLWSAVAGFASGILASMGMGGGGILIIALSLFSTIEQSRAQGINLLFFIPIALLSVIIYARKGLIEWKIVVPFALLGITGSLLGSWLSSQFSNDILSKMFGVLLLIMGVKEFFSKPKDDDGKPQKDTKT